MYTIVTGAAGFIGANLVKALNERGNTRIIAVDNLKRAEKFKNLVDCEIVDYFDKEDFLARVAAGDFDGDIDAIFHEGACSDTMEMDGRYMMENNFRYSLQLLDWCQEQEVPFLYASSAATYGGSSEFREERQFECGGAVVDEDAADLLVVGQRGAEIAVQQAAEIVDVLHDERTVVAGRMDALLQFFRGQAAAECGGDRVAGGAHHEENDGYKNEYCRNDQQKACEHETEESA